MESDSEDDANGNEHDDMDVSFQQYVRSNVWTGEHRRDGEDQMEIDEERTPKHHDVQNAITWAISDVVSAFLSSRYNSDSGKEDNTQSQTSSNVDTLSRAERWKILAADIMERYSALQPVHTVIWKFSNPLEHKNASDALVREEEIPILHFSIVNVCESGQTGLLDMIADYVAKKTQHAPTPAATAARVNTSNNDNATPTPAMRLTLWDELKLFESSPWYYLSRPETLSCGVLGIPFGLLRNTSAVTSNSHRSRVAYHDHQHFPMNVMRDRLFAILKLDRLNPEHNDIVFPRVKFLSAFAPGRRNQKAQLGYETKSSSILRDRIVPVGLLPLFLAMAPKEWIVENNGLANILYDLRNRVHLLCENNATGDYRALALAKVTLYQFDANMKRVFDNETVERAVAEKLMQSVTTNNVQIAEMRRLMLQICSRLDQMEKRKAPQAKKV